MDAEDEERLRRDRERVAKDFDPYSESFNLHRTNPRRQEAYDQCSPEVVALMKCVDAEGPTWFWRCNSHHNALQRCYEAHKSHPPAPFEDTIREIGERVVGTWKFAVRAATDLIRSSSAPPSSSSSSSSAAGESSTSEQRKS